jgi:hypothetical protein
MPSALERAARLLPDGPGAPAAHVRRGGAADASAAGRVDRLSASSAAGAVLCCIHRTLLCPPAADTQPTGLPG